MKTVFPAISDETRVRMLTPPDCKVDFVLDTDTYNEIDDQFALVYALLSPERLNVRAICAAPFFNSLSTSPKDGMEKSYDEILRILSRMGVSPDGLVFKGSEGYLPDEDTPVESAAARRIVELAGGHSAEDPLYVAAIGAITNVASALLLDPSIAEKMVLIWLGGHSFQWPHTREFNLIQDVAAARVVFGCGVPVVQLPCMGVVDHLTTTMPEVDTYVRGKGAIGDFLADTFKNCAADHFGYSRVIWDMTTIAWLVNPGSISTSLQHSPIVSYEGNYSFDPNRHLMLYAWHVSRDEIFRDFFRRLAGFAEKNNG